MLSCRHFGQLDDATAVMGGSPKGKTVGGGTSTTLKKCAPFPLALSPSISVPLLFSLSESDYCSNDMAHKTHREGKKEGNAVKKGGKGEQRPEHRPMR